MAIHRIKSLVTGTVWKIECQAGQAAGEGDTLMILESMKMEIPMEAPAAGTMTALRVAEGERVTAGQVLAVWVSG